MIGGSRGYGGEYRYRKTASVRLALGIQDRRRVGPFGELALDAAVVRMGEDADCEFGIRRRCVPGFPAFGGPEIVGGISARTDRYLQARAGVGAGAYSANGTFTGGVVLQGDVALFPASAFGLVVAAKSIMVPRYDHDRLSARAVTVGFRVR